MPSTSTAAATRTVTRRSVSVARRQLRVGGLPRGGADTSGVCPWCAAGALPPSPLVLLLPPRTSSPTIVCTMYAPHAATTSPAATFVVSPESLGLTPSIVSS